LTQDRNPATYTAPAAVPANNLVAVSAILTPDGSTQLTLSKNLYVLAHKYHVDVVFEDQTTCTPLPAGGTPVFGYDIFTGGNFSITFNSSLNGTAGDFVSTTDTPPTTLAPSRAAPREAAPLQPGRHPGPGTRRGQRRLLHHQWRLQRVHHRRLFRPAGGHSEFRR